MAEGKVTEAERTAKMAERKARVQQRLIWYGDKVQNNIQVNAKKRLLIAGQALRDLIVVNISRPVTKTRVKATGAAAREQKTMTKVTNRSKPGEYPKADTTRLMKDIFYDTRKDGMSVIVGTSLDYGAVLELSTRLDRAYIMKTYNENRDKLARIIGKGDGAPKIEGDIF